MTWLLWQQHRRQVLVVGAALVAVAAFLLVTGRHLAQTYHDAIRACADRRPGCGTLSTTIFGSGANRLIDIVLAAGFLVPFVLALFWGAPLLSKEYEDGTHRLAWTQSVPRLAWLRIRLCWVTVAALVLAGTLAALITWWYGPVNAIELNRLGSAVFDSQGIEPVAYTLFGVALGMAVGALLRRTVAAMGTTLLLFVVVRYLVSQYLRPALLPAKTLLASLSGSGTGGHLTGSWLLSETIVNAAGRPVALSQGSIIQADVPAGCRDLTGNRLGECLDTHGYHYLVAYQPGGRFWALQGIEAALFVGAAACLVAFTFWWVARKDA
jgi:hypothetical protein